MSAHPTVRFVGGHWPYKDPPEFDWECRIVSRQPAEIWLETLTNPPHRIGIGARYVGQVISGDTVATQTCTYILDDDDSGMALWTEDRPGVVIVKAFDYPG